MKKIRTIIIDDELSCTETLTMELEMFCPQVEVIATCNSASDGLKEITAQSPDLVFLDIEMPWMNGFELLQQINQINFEVIFVTAYDQFALKAFKFSAVDFLLKPVKKADLIAAVSKVEDRLQKNLTTEHIEALLSNMQFLHHEINSIAVPTQEGIEFIPVDDIIYCSADNNYTFIHKQEGSPLLLSKSLKQIESMLSAYPFVRIHQSHLINMKHIRKYIRGSGGYVIMSNGQQLAVARARKDDIINWMNK